jgi:hypothetical protein
MYDFIGCNINGLPMAAGESSFSICLPDSLSFKYLHYYKALSITQGALIGTDHAAAYAIMDYSKEQILNTL